MAGFTLIQTPTVRSALQTLQRQVDNKTRDARRLIGAESVAALRNPSTSKVNVGTGKMRRSFAFKVAAGNNRINILNDATSPRGFRYPLLVEKRYGGAARTIRVNRATIVRNTNRRLKRRVPVRLRNERP